MRLLLGSFSLKIKLLLYKSVLSKKFCIHYRNNHSSLRRGSLEFLPTNQEEDVLAYIRIAEDDAVIIVLNSAAVSKEVDIQVPPAFAGMRWNRGLGNGEFKMEDGRLHVSLPRKSGLTIESP